MRCLLLYSLGCCLLLTPFLLFAQQKPLDHSVYDGWQSISERLISNNGKYVAYTISPQEGDGVLVIAQTAGRPLLEVPRGYNLAMTEDSRYLVFKIKPLYRETREARIKKKKPDELPKDSLGIVELDQALLTRYPRVKSYKLPAESGGWLAFLAEKALPETARSAAPDSLARLSALAHMADSLVQVADSLRHQLANAKEQGLKVLQAGKKEPRAAAARPGEEQEEGTVLVLKHLNGGEEKKYPLVSEYAFDKKGTALALRTTAKNGDTASVARVLWIHLPTLQADTVMQPLNDARNLTFDEAGTQLAFVAERDSSAAKAAQKFYKLWYYKTGQDSARLLAHQFTKGMLPNWAVSENGSIRFSKSGNRLFFGTAPILPPKDTTLPEWERVSLDVWHYKDNDLQPTQLFGLNRELKRSYTAMYHWGRGEVMQLADTVFRQVQLTNEGDGEVFYTSTDTGRHVASQWQGYSLTDVYAVEASTGARLLVEKNFKGSLFPSATGKYLLLYHDRRRSYTVYNAAARNSYPVAGDVSSPLYDDENDMPDDPDPQGVMGWDKDDRYVYIYDKYNIQRVNPTGKKMSSTSLVYPLNKQLRIRYLRTREDETYIDATRPVYVSVFNTATKRTALAAIDKPGDLTYAAFHYIAADTALSCDALQKAKYAAVYLFTKQSFRYPADLYTADSITAAAGKALTNQTTVLPALQLSHINPQQQQYLWGTAQLYQWKAYTGKLSEGILYKPDHFDAKKRYPMIVYFYERNNETLYNYRSPAPTPSALNIPFFVSRGYVVFVPDIWYKTGHPGKSAYDYIVSGTRALIREGFIDSTKIGLQGQSWGGYQTAYLITQTHLYAAAWAGAPVVNMFSAYGGIRWEGGINRQFQYEHTQSRIGATIWENPGLYVENSPLFHLPNVKTPLVIMSNDADGAVPWYQGIEFFTAMRRLNKPVWLLNYNGEAHNLVKRKNRKDISIRQQEYFDWLLKGERPAKWLVEGVPAIMKGRDWGLQLQ